jgi:hypothetical protein
LLSEVFEQCVGKQCAECLGGEATASELVGHRVGPRMGVELRTS